jgi:hypothetical protein
MESELPRWPSRQSNNQYAIPAEDKTMIPALISVNRLGFVSAESLDEKIVGSIYIKDRQIAGMFLDQLIQGDREEVENGYEVEAEVDSLYFQVSTQEYEKARENARQAYKLLFKLSTKIDNFIWDNIHNRSEILESLKQCNEHIETALCILDAYDV